MPFFQVLRFLLAYQDEDVYPVWSGILSILGSVEDLLNGTPLIEDFKSFARHMLTPVASRLGWDAKENESWL